MTVRTLCKTPPRGMTFVEVLIAVVILAVVATIVVPEMSEASSDVLESKLRDDLRDLRAQLGRYRKDHGRYPRGDRLIAQLTLRTNAFGEVQPASAAAQAYPFGPYLDRFPENPFVHYPFSHHVRTEGSSADENPAGWFYHSPSGRICPDDEDHAGW